MIKPPKPPARPEGRESKQHTLIDFLLMFSAVISLIITAYLIIFKF